MEWNMGLQFESLLFLLQLLLLPSLSISGPISTYIITPNFTASNYQYIDHSGVFLQSPNSTFKAAISNTSPQLKRFYFSVVHAASDSVIWTANRNSPVSDSAQLSLTPAGLSLTDDSRRPIWSIPPLPFPVASMRLDETGNLVLLDAGNVTLWQSFDHPTDTIVSGQKLPVGTSLSSSVSDEDPSVGGYRFTVTGSDAVMQWNGLAYWKLSMDTNAYQDSTAPVSYMAVNGTGLYLFGGGDGYRVVFRVVLDSSPSSSVFKIAKLGSDGRFRIIHDGGVEDKFGAPSDFCRIPMICGKIGLCSNGGFCSCPPNFHNDPQFNASCVPTATSYSLPSACNATGNNKSNPPVSYLKLGDGMDYFANDFMEPTKDGVNLSSCQDLCSQNCSCLGIFHGSSGYCYLIENHLGSIMASSPTNKDRLGYIKALVGSTPSEQFSGDDSKSNFPLAGLVLLPSFGFFLLIILIFLGLVWWKRNRISVTAAVKLGRNNSSSSGELEIISIPGLPVRFNYEDLVAATENFNTHIGSGGFGTVYKGTLPDKTVVAVKKITNLGIQGKREFCTEIAIIGNIHHVNLVRLKGFCAFRRQRFLVYEYMNRGSLGGALFGHGPVLEWQERFEIALGTARALAYLHYGCEHKIIHCDVKPENILLHEHLQVKISDFGLSKLLSPEQSSLFTTMRGTRGYLAPEWLTSSAITDKTDVYSYGMVLLEIVRGKKNCALQAQTHSDDSSSSTEGAHNHQNRPILFSSSSGSTRTPPPVYFPMLALEMHEKGRYMELADPRLEGRVRSEEVEKLVRVALCCVHEDPVLRPTMANVVGMLEGGLGLGEPRIESLNFLRFYGRRFTEASTLAGSNSRSSTSDNQNQNQQEHDLVYGTNNFNYYYNTSASGSHNSMSYISSQQVSGPR